MESEQITGSFKFRGAANKVLSLSTEDLRHGAVTASTGNHGKAFATISKIVGRANAIVFVPKNASLDKSTLIRLQAAKWSLKLHVVQSLVPKYGQIAK